MIKSVHIKNFKSIKEIRIKCSRINIFIGQPNTGKSNILEAIVGLPSYIFHWNKGTKKSIKNFIRLEEISDIFYDKNLDEKVEIEYEDKKRLKIDILFERTFYIDINFDGRISRINLMEPHSPYPGSDYLKSFKFYRFEKIQRFQSSGIEYLLPPNGENLFSIILTNKEIRNIVSEMFKPLGLKLILVHDENKIRVGKFHEENILIMYPYTTISDTLQRLIFFISAIKSNKNSILSFEEPEAHAFPYYTKYLAEIISRDKSNQYFISTHNPYILLTLLEKTPIEDIKVFITYFEDYQTKVKELSEKKLEEILKYDIDVFFNIEELLEE